jgi:integrase
MQTVTYGGRVPKAPIRGDNVAGPLDPEVSAASPALAGALKAMGLNGLDPGGIAPEFREPLVRLAACWEAAIAASTLASRRCDLRRFAQWCECRGQAPFVSDRALAALMEAHVVEVGQTFAPGTAKRVGSNLTALATGLGSDRAARGTRERRRLAVRAAWKIERARGVTHRKPRLSVAQLRAMRANIEASDVLPLRRLRDLALFDAMCDLLARRSEIVGLRLPDLDLAAVTVRISYSKTDQAGRGTVFRISMRTVASLDAWLGASGLREFLPRDAGALPVFVAVMNDGTLRRGRNGVPTRMDGRTVARILQRYAEPLGIPGVAGHSLRRSMARALHEAGFCEDEIVRMGRWSSRDQMREYVGLTVPIQGAAALLFQGRPSDGA